MKYVSNYGNEYDLSFYESTYANNGRRYVCAVTSEGEPYADLTINIPDEWQDIDEVFFNADADHLVRVMCDKGYLIVLGAFMHGYGIYKHGRFTSKFEEIVRKLK